jgi:hypothetical protein
MRETNGRAAIEAVDLLVWEVVTASGELAQGAECGLARLLREGAATALAGVAAACNAQSRQAGIEGLAGVLGVLRRLGTWLDLAERFGDLAPDHTLAALEAQGRAMAAVDELAATWRDDAATAACGEGGGAIELALPAAVCAGGASGRAAGSSSAA